MNGALYCGGCKRGQTDLDAQIAGFDPAAVPVAKQDLDPRLGDPTFQPWHQGDKKERGP